MKIIRDGKEYELTENEMRQAWDEIHVMDLRDDVEYYFNCITVNTPAFKDWRNEHVADFKELIDEATYNCKFKEEMYGSCNIEDTVWETIDDHDEFEHMFDDV